MTLEPLSEVAEIVMGQSPPSSTYNTGGDGLPFFQGKADFGDRYPSVRVYCNEPTKIAERGDILISVRAPVGPTNIAPTRCCIGRGLAAIRGKKVDPTFLLHFFRYHEPQLATKGKGSTFEAINRDDLENLPVPLSTLGNQKKIAALLEKADRLRRTRCYARRLSDTFLQSVFLEMFGDPVANERAWDVDTLRSQCDNITDGTHDTPERVTSGVPFITSKNVRPYEIDLTELEFVTAETHREIIRRCNPRFGDVLYTNIGVNVGNAAANRLRFEFSLKNVALIQPNSAQLDSFYLESLLNNERFKQNVLRISSVGGAQKFVALEILREIKVIIPPLALQEKFADIVRRFERLRAQQREAERQGEHLFQTLLHRAFKAEL